jgi:hypothetical protein
VKGIFSRLSSWLKGKPKTWANLSDDERKHLMKEASGNLRSAPNQVIGEEVFGDAFGSAQVNPNSSQIGATTNQRGLGAVMSRRLFEPRKGRDD